MATDDRASSPQNQQPSPSAHQLTSEDYQNIWLRINDLGLNRIWALFVALVLVIGLAGGAGGYVIAQRMLEKEVAKYTSSREFRESLIQHTREQIPVLSSSLTDIEAKLDTLGVVIEQHQQKIAAMQRPPIAVDASTAWLTAPDGQSLRIESGRASLSMGETRIRFSGQFREPPTLVVSVESAGGPAFGGSINTSQVSPEGARVQAPRSYGTLHWIAIGR